MAPRPVDLPTGFRLGEERWRISSSPKDWARAGFESNGRGLDFARTDAYARVIVINPELLARDDIPRTQVTRSLMHELVHVALSHAGWCEDRVAEGEVEESVAHAIEGPLAELFARNWSLVAFFGA